MPRTAFATSARVTSLLGAFIGCAVQAQNHPPSFIPRDLAVALMEGDTRLIVVGDSLCTNTFGDPSGANHAPLTVGIQRRWRPLRWHGIFAPPSESVPSSYSNLRGVGAAAFLDDDSFVNMIPVWMYSWPSGNNVIFGFGTQTCYSAVISDPAALITYAPRTSYWLYPASTVQGCAATQLLLSSPSLRIRHLVFTNPDTAISPTISLDCFTQSNQWLAGSGTLTVPNAALGWASMDMAAGAALPPSFPASGVALRVDVGLPTPGVEEVTYTTMGTIFDDPSAPGLQVYSISQGGWNNGDHLRSSGSGRGYTNDGLRAALRVVGAADPGSTPVVMIATGTNIAPGESISGGCTDVFNSNIAALIERYRVALAGIGAAQPWFLLVGMHSISFPPDVYAASRNDRMADVAAATPRCGFVDLRALMGERGEGFNSSWYFRQAETHSASDYSGGSTLVTTGVSSFLYTDSFYIIDGVHAAMGAYNGYNGSTLMNVELPGVTFGAGARIVAATAADIHFSRAGSEHAADVIWDAILRGRGDCTADFNTDGDSATDADIEAFFACLAGNCCPTCGTADFNGDGDSATDADIESFFRVLGGGAC